MLVKIEAQTTAALIQLVNNLIEYNLNFIVKGNTVLFNNKENFPVYRGLWTKDNSFIQKGVTCYDRKEYAKIAK